MAEPYLTDLRDLIDRQALPDKIICKHFFSGAAAYAGERIFMSLTPAGLALKLSPDHLEEAFANGAMPLKYFPKAPVKKDYALLPRHIVEDEKVLRSWLVCSLGFVGI